MKLEAILQKLGLLQPGKIMYIGGSDILPPPLAAQEEQTRTERAVSRANIFVNLFLMSALHKNQYAGATVSVQWPPVPLLLPDGCA